MNGEGKSDLAIVAEKPANKAACGAAEQGERRAGTEGNAGQQSTNRAQNRGGVFQALERIRQAARTRRKAKFTALLHHVNVDLLREAFFATKRDAAPGVDGLTWGSYEADLEGNLAVLHHKVQGGAYRALPSKRAYIPKADGRLRPLAIAALEDKLVQRAVATVMSAVYEEDFLGFSYGFRPGRGQHDALDALVVGISGKKVNYVLDADIQSFFDSVDQQWFIRFVEHRIQDPRVIRLIRRWMAAGVIEDGQLRRSPRGTGQGSAISPLLANVYLHYAFDLWAQRWRRREARGDMILVRYADDIVVGFQQEGDACRFRTALAARLAQFALTLHPDKTRILAFGRFAAAQRRERGLPKPETFNFLGFTFICGKSKRGKFLLHRKSRRDRMRAKLKEVKAELSRRRHEPITEQGRWLGRVVRGYFAYHAVPTNSRALAAFRHHVKDLWRRSLRRRSQKDRTTWERIARLADEFLPAARILHPWPSDRFAVRHPRWEPSARVGPARFCAGGSG